MSVDLLKTVRLLHRVFGFLAQETAEHLDEITEGRRRLMSISSDDSVRATTVGPPTPSPTVTPEARLPRARNGKARSAPDQAPDEDYARFAEELRAQESEEAGAAFLASARLAGRKLRKSDLIKLGEHLSLTLTNSSTVPEMTRKLVGRAIGARKKYAGLTKW
jgi:hypothetical protein